MLQGKTCFDKYSQQTLPEAGPEEQLQPRLEAGDGQAGVPGPLQVRAEKLVLYTVYTCTLFTLGQERTSPLPASVPPAKEEDIK